MEALEIDGVYLTSLGDEVQIRKIDSKKGIILLYNITNQCNVHLFLDKTRIIKKIK